MPIHFYIEAIFQITHSIILKKTFFGKMKSFRRIAATFSTIPFSLNSIVIKVCEFWV